MAVAKMTPKIMRAIVQAHKRYWDDQQRDMYRFKRAYECRFWSSEMMDPTQITIQTSDAYGYIESYISSLFTKNPGVVVKNGLKGTGAPKKATALCNDFLSKQRAPIEDASRLALIYPNSFIKVYPKDAENVYDRVDLTAVPPWNVIIDRDALRWEDSRFVGHIYYMNLPLAKGRFGNKDFRHVQYEQYFDKFAGTDKTESDIDDIGEGDAHMFQYIEVIEFYDIQNDTLYFYSEQYAQGNKWLEKGQIPFRDLNDEVVIPVIPMYYNRLPDRPMVGYSAMRRIYDQIFEINMIRTYQANAVRKCSRQYIIKKGTLDEDQIAQITSGIDGLFIEIDNDDLAGAIRPLPQNPTPPELETYYRQVQDDKDKGSIMAPFTRGEATKASATEIAALAAYTSTELGRLARERDNVIEYIAKAYLSIVSLYINEDNVRDLIVIDGETVVITPDDLSSDFYVYAIDQASTPISETIRKREFIQSIPLLQSLGVPNETLLKELVNALNLPDYILEESRPPPSLEQPGAQGMMPPGGGEIAGGIPRSMGNVEIAPGLQEQMVAAAQPMGPGGPANLAIPGRRSV